MIDTYIIGDITDREAKTFGMFTMRQAICGGLGIGVALAMMFAVLPKDMDSTNKIIISFICCLPFFLLTNPLYDMPLEKILPILIYDNFILPMNRYYIPDVKKEDARDNNFKYLDKKTRKKFFKAIKKDSYKSIYH